MVTLNRPSLFHKTDWQEILSSHLKTVLAIALLLSIPTAARAEHKRGEKTFSFSGSLTSLVSQDGPTMGSGEVDFGLGYLLASRLQLLVEPSLTFDSSPTSSGHTDWTVDGGLTTSVRYYLRKDQKATVQPYLGPGDRSTPRGQIFLHSSCLIRCEREVWIQAEQSISPAALGINIRIHDLVLDTSAQDGQAAGVTRVEQLGQGRIPQREGFHDEQKSA